MTKKTTAKTTAAAIAPTEAAHRIVTPWPLELLVCAEENARFGDTSDVSGLAASIAAAGLQDPLKVYEANGVGHVYDGGRRLRALKLLASSASLPAAYMNGVPVLLGTREDARRNSLVTFVREDMHPADRFVAFNRLFDEGRTPEEIAATCDVSARDVAQLLRFRVLAPEILEAFRAERMDFDAALAFTASDDQERQRAVLASFQGDAWRTIPAWAVRERIRVGAVSPSDRLARFVGRDAYLAAGGQLLVDLFTGREADEDWADAGLVQRLAAEKLDAETAKVKAEGWGEVIVPTKGYGYATGFERLPKVDIPKGKKTEKGWTPEQMGGAVAFVYVEYDGSLKVERGFHKPGKTAAEAAAKPQTAAQAKAKADPSLFGYGQTGHHKLTTVATSVTRAALLKNPEAAYDAMLTHLAWTTFRRSSGYGSTEVSTLTKDREGYGQRAAGIATAEDALYGEEWSRWNDRLPTTRVAFCDYVGELPPAEKAALLAFCFAGTLNGVEEKLDNHNDARWAHLGWIAKRAGVEVARAWTPDVEFLKSASKPALVAAFKELQERGARVDGYYFEASCKKGDMVAKLASLAAEHGWTPTMLQNLTEVSAEAELAEQARQDADRAARHAAQDARYAAEDAEDLDGQDIDPDTEENLAIAREALLGE
jgi:ParB family chromosome partitioning protein